VQRISLDRCAFILESAVGHVRWCCFPVGRQGAFSWHGRTLARKSNVGRQPENSSGDRVAVSPYGLSALNSSSNQPIYFWWIDWSDTGYSVRGLGGGNGSAPAIAAFTTSLWLMPTQAYRMYSRRPLAEYPGIRWVAINRHCKFGELPAPVATKFYSTAKRSPPFFWLFARFKVNKPFS